METWLRELRFALRYLVRRRGATLTAVLALGLGTGGATTVFSVLHGVLLRPLDYPDSERIVALGQISPRGQRMSNMSEPNFEDLRAQTRSFAALAAYGGGVQSVSGGSEPMRVGVAVVSEGFFDVLKTRPALGRVFSAEEQVPGAPAVAVVGHGFWRRALGARADLAALRLRIAERTYGVVGVLPPGPALPVGTEIWTSKAQLPRNTSRTAHNSRTLGRLRDGVTLEAARADASRVARRLREQYKDDTWMTDADVRTLREALVGGSSQTLWLLFGAVGFLLLVACANVANLLLAQATVRQGELLLRVAIGASRGQILRQLLSETLLLSLGGGALGVLLAAWGVRALLAFEPGKLPRVQDVSVSREVLLFSLGVSLLTAVALGLATALRAARHAPGGALATGGRAAAGPANRRLLEGLVASQVAATAALLVGAGLLGRSLQRVMDVDPGFRGESVVAMDVALAPGNAPERLAARARFHDELLERLRALPGVRQVGAVSAVPLSGGGPDGTYLATDAEIGSFDDFALLMKDPRVAGQAEFRVASEGYFRALGIPLVRGRLFGAEDGPDAPHVAVVSESFARKQWGAADPIGRRVHFGNMDGELRPFTIVGIVGDVREYGLAAGARPTLYGSTRQRRRALASLSFVAHGDGEPRAFVAAARAIVRELDPELPPRFRTLAEIRHASLADRRFTLLLLGLFGATALSLAALGIYGVTSYSVAARTREVGVRMAIGAEPRQVLRMVLLDGARSAVAGVLAGVVLAALLSRLLTGLLYEVAPGDPATLAAVALLLGGVALLSGLPPALHAARVDPALTLRGD
jgi:predicted permease